MSKKTLEKENPRSLKSFYTGSHQSENITLSVGRFKHTSLIYIALLRQFWMNQGFSGQLIKYVWTKITQKS